MNEEKSHYQTRLALASFAAGIAQTLNESDISFTERLNANLEKIYLTLRDSGQDNLGTLEAIQNFQLLLKS